MNASESVVIAERVGPTLMDRCINWIACLMPAVLLAMAGWGSLRPDDPLGAVTLLAREGDWLSLLQTGVMAMFAALMATALAGRRLVDVGALAAAMGLALVSLRGRTVSTLLVVRSDGDPFSQRGLALAFGAEALGWSAVVCAVVVTSAVAARRFHRAVGDSAAAHDHAPIPAGIDLALSAGWIAPPRPIPHTPLSTGLTHTALATCLGLVFVPVFSTGLATRSIQHGQVCFVVAASIFLAAYSAYRWVPVRSAFWSIAGALATALIAYLWAAVVTQDGRYPAIPASCFLRILPVQFVAVGTAAAVAAFWYLEGSDVGPHRDADAPAPRSRGGA